MRRHGSSGSSSSQVNRPLVARSTYTEYLGDKQRVELTTAMLSRYRRPARMAFANSSRSAPDMARSAALNRSIGPCYHRAVLLGNHLAELAPNSNGGVKELRLRNLQALADAKGWKPADFVREVGKSPSYWSDMLRGSKGFGESVAREVEEKVGLPRVWLDQDHDRREPPPLPMPNAAQALDVVARLIAKLPKLDRRQVGALLPLLAEEPDSRQQTCAAILRWIGTVQPVPAQPEFSALAQDLAKQLDAIPDENGARTRAHAAAIALLSAHEVRHQVGRATGAPTQPPEPGPGVRPRKAR